MLFIKQKTSNQAVFDGYAICGWNWQYLRSRKFVFSKDFAVPLDLHVKQKRKQRFTRSNFDNVAKSIRRRRKFAERL